MNKPNSKGKGTSSKGVTKAKTSQPKPRRATQEKREGIAQRTPKQRYTVSEKLAAGLEYAICGSYLKTQSITGIPESTLRSFNNAGEWDSLTATYRDEKTAELRAKYVKGCELAIDHTIKTLDQATPAQSAVISGVFFDKTRLIDNQSTVIRSDSSSMAQMISEFENIAKQVQANVRANAKIISEQ